MFKSLSKAVLGVAVLPVDIVADIVTVGGLITNKQRPYTVKRASDIMDNLNKATEGQDDD